MKKCLFCGNEFEELSKEHIIPNAICGRIKSRNLICKDCNSSLGDEIDNGFNGVYNQVINLFGIKREEDILNRLS
ncbi:MAG: HNH endonuclease [Candidatus Melainabacteria bacterium]|nr:MAG: HNH endonuclease [Candidatus Melainabacteria bacterium]